MIDQPVRPAKRKSSMPILATSSGPSFKPRPVAQSAALVQRRSDCMALFNSNRSVYDTVEAMKTAYPDYNYSKCYHDIAASLNDLAIARVEFTREMVAIELEKLGKLEEHTEKLLASDSEGVQIMAIQTLLNISKSRRKLLGLDAAKQAIVSVEHSIADKVLQAQKTIDAEYSEA